MNYIEDPDFKKKSERPSLEFSENLDGIRWYKADPPPYFHKHWAQSRAYYNDFGGVYIERCACGARNVGHGWFTDKCDHPLRTQPRPEFKWKLWPFASIWKKKR